MDDEARINQLLSEGNYSGLRDLVGDSHDEADTARAGDDSAPAEQLSFARADEESDAGQEKQQPLAAQQPALTGLDIRDPLELLIFLDDNIASGKVTLYQWQKQIMIDFAAGGQSDAHPLQQVLRACNGSGKDKYIIAACSVWLCMAHVKARGVITSSSGAQLDNQTGTYIDMLCEAANSKFQSLFNCPVWKINYRYYECLVTGSPLALFATDEPRKAEGYHPLEPGAKMGIFVSEDKTVPDEINIALNKCTGYTHRLHVSTPGSPLGHFKSYCDISVDRKAIKSVRDVGPTDWIQYHVTAYDCAHLSRSYIEQMKRDLPGGESGPAFRSQVLAEFGSDDQMVVIPSLYVWKAVNGSRFGWRHAVHNDAGLDLSDGGDETVLAIRNGNRLLHVIAFKFDNTQDTVRFLDAKFREFGLNNNESHINADCGGLGKPILDQLKELGWHNIHYVDNRNKPNEPRTYKNRGAELWFNFRKMLEANEIWLCDDLKLRTQLSNRMYKIVGNLHQLESKIDARAKGHPSPDRADAVVLAFWNYAKLSADLTVPKPFELPKQPDRSAGTFTLNGHANRDSKRSIDDLKPSRRTNLSLIHDLVREHNQLIRSVESN